MVLTPRTAFIDESFRRDSDGRGYSLLTAVVVPDANAAAVEHRLRRFVPAGQRRFHWRDESRASKRRFVTTVADLAHLAVTACTYCQETDSHKKLEQARMRSIWMLLGDLGEQQISTLVFESRQERNDRKDRREVISAQKAGLVDPDLVYRHGRPKEDPLLWLPDAIAGTVGDQIAAADSELLDLLPEEMCRIRWLARP